MKLWWPKLYTIPSLKKFAWPLAAWLAANLLCVSFFPKIREITFLVAMYPWFVFINDNENTLGNNLDFHRVNVPYKELRRALLLDVLIQVFFFVTVFALFGHLPWLGVVEESRIFDVIGTPATMTLFLITFLFGVASPKLGIVKQRQAVAAHKIKQSLAQRKGRTSLAFFLLLLGVYLVKTQGLSFLLVAYVGASSAFLSTLAEWYFENFHLWPKRREMIEVAFPMVFIAFFSSLALGLSSMAREEIADDKQNPIRRKITFEMFQDFGVVLDPHTAADLIEVSYVNEDYQEIFEHSVPEVFEVEVDQLIKSPDYRAYYNYLMTGKVASHNLQYLFQKTLSDKAAWRNAYYYPNYREALVKHYPEASSLPSRNIASKKGAR